MTPEELEAEARYRERCAAALRRLAAHNIKVTEHAWNKGVLHINIVLSGVPKTLTVPREEAIS